MKQSIIITGVQVNDPYYEGANPYSKGISGQITLDFSSCGDFSEYTYIDDDGNEKLNDAKFMELVAIAFRDYLGKEIDLGDTDEPYAVVRGKDLVMLFDSKRKTSGDTPYLNVGDEVILSGDMNGIQSDQTDMINDLHKRDHHFFIVDVKISANPTSIEYQLSGSGFGTDIKFWVSKQNIIKV